MTLRPQGYGLNWEKKKEKKKSFAKLCRPDRQSVFFLPFFLQKKET